MKVVSPQTKKGRTMHLGGQIVLNVPSTESLQSCIIDCYIDWIQKLVKDKGQSKVLKAL